MGTIAKGMITLSSLNDAYTVSLSPNSCVINADFDGSNPRLANAFTHVTVKRGTVSSNFTLALQSISNNNIQYTVSQIDSYTKSIQLTQIPSDILSGSLEFLVSVGNEFSTLITFQFTVVRESTMLDWIQDWENNKTTIGSTYLITPKIFVGSRITTSADMNSLTGVYIGPDENNGAGIYGLKAGEEIFHLNQYGGSIGGWDIVNGGIQTQDGTLRILSSGSIIVQDAQSNVIWGIYKSGEATFAQGNVQFHADGSASFAGSITANSGTIGGWTIAAGLLHSNNTLLSSNNNYIGISAASSPSSAYLTHRSGIVDSGGVFMSYISANSYGIFGYLPKDGGGNTRLAFSVGSTNQIAGWNFDNEAIWLGTKLNQLANYAPANSITIGTNGLRGANWYIDTTGAVSFLSGLVSFSGSGGSLVGWSLREERFSTDYAAVISNSSHAGVYLSKYNISNIATSSLVTTIQGNGGIYMRRTGGDVEFVGYKGTTKVFHLSSTNDSQIAAWYFNNTALYMGTLTTTGFTGQSGDITIGSTGIRGFKWRLESDGSGALAGGNIAWAADGSGSIAGGNISWNASGSVSLSSNVTISFSQCKDGSGNSVSSYLTNIGLDGIYTGTIHANEGYIGAWHINTNEQIVSTLSTDANTNRIVLDASLNKISLFSASLNNVTDMMSAYSNIGSVISIDANNGIVETRAKNAPNYTSAVSYISPTGVFSNFAGTQALSLSTGMWHQGAVVGIGCANINKSEWSFGADETIVAGVYGRANNSGTAPAFGGYFWNLKACGLILNRKFISDNTTDGYSLSYSDTLVIGLCNQGITRIIYLPTDGIEGRIVFIEQMGRGTLRVQVKSGQSLYDDTSENDYYDIAEGQMGIFTCGIWDKGDVTTQVWMVRKFKF